MLETGNCYSNVTRLLCAVFVVCTGFAAFPGFAHAAMTVQKTEWHVDTATLQKGYTFQTAGSEIRLGMPSASVNDSVDEAWVRLRQVKKSRVVIPKPKKLLSRVYAYAVYHTETRVSIDNPLWLSLAWDTDTDQDYVIKRWNAETQKWAPLATAANTEQRRASTTVTEPVGIVAVFSKKHHETTEYTGGASWMWFNGGAAMNVVPLGTRIEVENPQTGATATTTVVSTGPFVPNRIIDLPYDIFDTIGNPSAGVMDVIVRVLQ